MVGMVVCSCSSWIVSYFTSRLTFHVAYQSKWKSKLFQLSMMATWLPVCKETCFNTPCLFHLCLPQSFQGSYYFSPSVRPSLFSPFSASILFFNLSQNKIVEKILLVHKSSSHAAYLMHSVIRQTGLKAPKTTFYQFLNLNAY